MSRVTPVTRAPVTRGAAAATYLALGDSYTIGESVDAADRYPAQAAGLLRKADHLSCQDP